MNGTSSRPPRSRRWLDPRLAIGIGLVVVSLVGVWLVVDTATRSTPVYAAATTLSAGDRLDASDLVVVQARLGDARERYVADGALPADGAVVTRTVLAGELVPQSAIGRAEEVDAGSVVIESDTALPEAVTDGAIVDVWAAEPDEGGSFGPPSVIVDGASVVRVVESDGLVGSDGATVEILVPAGKIASVLASISRGDAISIVPAG